MTEQEWLESTDPKSIVEFIKQDRAWYAVLEASHSLVIAIALLLIPSRQPIHPVMLSIPGMIAAVGLALGLSALRFGSWRTKAVASVAICGNTVVLFAIGHDLVALW